MRFNHNSNDKMFLVIKIMNVNIKKLINYEHTINVNNIQYIVKHNAITLSFCFMNCVYINT